MVSAQHAFGRSVGHEFFGNVDGDVLPFAHDPAQTTKMVGVGVGHQNRAHRSVTKGVVDQLERRLCGFAGQQRVDDDPAAGRGDDAHVGVVGRAHLPQAVGHLEQSADRIELCMTPERGVGGVGAVLLQECKPRRVPRLATVGTKDTASR